MALYCATYNDGYNSYICEPSAAGTETYFASPTINVSAITLSGTIVTSIVMTGSSKFQELRPYTERAEATSIGSTNEFGSTTYLHNTKFEYVGVSDTSIQHAKKLHRASSFIIQKAASGKYFLFGANGVSNPSTQKGLVGKGNVEIVFGIKAEDFNGIRVELEAKCGQPIYEIDSSIVASLVQVAA